MRTVVLYSPLVTSRLRYIISVLLEDALGLEVKIFSDKSEALVTGLPLINFSNEGSEGLQVIPHPILFDYGVKDYKIEVSPHNGFRKIFFRSGGREVPFDIFGASFWLLSRYEEYLPHKNDAFNRFHYKSSLAWQHGFLEIPLVNAWMDEFKKNLSHRYPHLEFKNTGYSFVSTVDIDNAYRYLHKGFVRSMAGYLSDAMRKDIGGLKERSLILARRKNDPFDCYDFLIEAHRTRNVKCIYFFLLGDYGINDKNHSATNLGFQSLIKQLSDYSETGIHPSFGSGNNLRQLRVEISRLAQITHRPVIKSRQHFSILRFPETYSSLLQAGVREDYSMGYTNMNGFRASYCHPYFWYNLEEEQVTPLLVHPFVISENTVEYYMQKNKSSFEEQVRPISSEVRKYGGELVSVFHNNNFNEAMRKQYLLFLEMAS